MKRVHVLLIGLLIAFGVSLHAVQSTINVGSSANDGTGDTLRSAMQKVNSNFTELYGTIFSFNGNQFGTSSSTNVYIKSGATLTNSVLYGSTSGSWTVGSDGTITAATSSSTNRINANIVNNTSVSSRARQGGLAFDGVTAASDLHTVGTIGTGDFSVHLVFQCPTSYSSFPTLMVASSTGSYTAAGALWFLFDSNAGGDLGFNFNNTDNNNLAGYKITNFGSSFGGKLVDVVFVRSSGVVTVYANGVSQTLTAANTGTPASWSDSVSAAYFRVGASSANQNLFNSTIYSAQLFTRALSASEVVDLANNGVSEADKWANLSNIITGDSADFAGGTVGSWSAVTAGSLAVVSQALQLTNSTGGNGMQLSSVSMRPKAGKRYRLSFTHKLVSGSAQQFAIRGSAGGSLFVALGSNVLTFTPSGTVATFTTEFTNTGDDQYLYFNLVGNDAVYEFDSFSLIEIGCLLDADLAVGVGYQAPDRSSNHYDGLISTSGVSHVIEQRRGQSRFSLSADGYLGDTTSRACIPDNARIESITAYSTGTPTFTVGDDSGSSANVVGSVTLTASTLTDLTLLKRFLTTGTDGRCYVDFTSGAAATTFTITYSTTGNY